VPAERGHGCLSTVSYDQLLEYPEQVMSPRAHQRR
jgi:hypothetical protein